MKQHKHHKKIHAPRTTNAEGKRVYVIDGKQYLTQADIRSGNYVGMIVKEPVVVADTTKEKES